jgi:hypothetical protein
MFSRVFVALLLSLSTASLTWGQVVLPDLEIEEVVDLDPFSLDGDSADQPGFTQPPPSEEPQPPNSVSPITDKFLDDLATIPEPSTIALLLIGIATLSLRLRNR